MIVHKNFAPENWDFCGFFDSYLEIKSLNVIIFESLCSFRLG